MLTYQRRLLKYRISTLLGGLLIGSWALGCGLMIWNASYDTDPVSSAFAQAFYERTVDNY